MSKPVHVYKAYINAPIGDVWNAITDGDKTVQYYYGTRVQSDWEVGSPIVYTNADGGVVADGEIVSVDAPKRLELTFVARWDAQLEAEGPAREAWLLNDVNGMTELTIELYDVAVDSKTYREFIEGFPYIVSGLKSLVETGRALPPPDPPD